MRVRRQCSARSIFMGRVDGATSSSHNNNNSNNKIGTLLNRTIISKCTCSLRTAPLSTKAIKTLNPNNSPLEVCSESRLLHQSMIICNSKTSEVVMPTDLKLHTSMTPLESSIISTSIQVATRQLILHLRTIKASIQKEQCFIRVIIFNRQSKNQMYVLKVTQS